MGYETRYKLRLRRGPGIADMPDEPEWRDLKRVIRRVKIYEESATCGQVMRGDLDPCKWYEHKDDMVRVSEMFPAVLFVLFGEGEEQGDSWREYYLNGAVQTCHAELRFPKFDLAKLVGSST